MEHTIKHGITREQKKIQTYLIVISLAGNEARITSIILGI